MGQFCDLCIFIFFLCLYVHISLITVWCHHFIPVMYHISSIGDGPWWVNGPWIRSPSFILLGVKDHLMPGKTSQGQRGVPMISRLWVHYTAHILYVNLRWSPIWVNFPCTDIAYQWVYFWNLFNLILYYLILCICIEWLSSQLLKIILPILRKPAFYILEAKNWPPWYSLFYNLLRIKAWIRSNTKSTRPFYKTAKTMMSANDYSHIYTVLTIACAIDISHFTEEIYNTQAVTSLYA